MLPLTEDTYKRVLSSTDYNIFDNSDIKAVFVEQSNDSTLADYVFSQSNPYTYLQSITSSPTLFALDNNIQYELKEADPGSGYTTNRANFIEYTGKIVISNQNFSADGYTDSFVFLVDQSLNEVVSYVKLDNDPSNQILNNINEIAWTNDKIYSTALYDASELTLSAGMIDFIKGEIDKDNLKIALIKDTTSSNVLHTYSTILSCSTVQSLSDVDGGNRIKIISTSHNLSGLDFYKFSSINNFGMCLKCSETTLYSSPDTQGFSPPYRAILYDISTQKPLVLFSEYLGIEGQDTVFIKANSTNVGNNILSLNA